MSERDTMLAFMKELSNALTSVRPLGGSELFVKRFDDYFADPAYCKAAIKRDAEARHEAMLERARAERNRDMWKGQCERQADQLRARQWQPIATAPKNGEPINIYVPIHQPDRRVLSAYWTDAGWWICSGSIVAGKPTHWQPLPEGPSVCSNPRNTQESDSEV